MNIIGKIPIYLKSSIRAVPQGIISSQIRLKSSKVNPVSNRVELSNATHHEFTLPVKNFEHLASKTLYQNAYDELNKFNISFQQAVDKYPLPVSSSSLSYISEASATLLLRVISVELEKSHSVESGLNRKIGELRKELPIFYVHQTPEMEALRSLGSKIVNLQYVRDNIDVFTGKTSPNECYRSLNLQHVLKALK